MIPKKMSAILTGDIVGSQSLSKTQQEGLAKTLAEAAAFAQLDKNLDVFRGDSWQAHCVQPELAVTKALIFRCILHGKFGIETRVAIGIGAVDSIKKDKLSLSHGEAFVLSGQSLNDMPSDRRISLAISENAPESSRSALQAACILLDALSANWTPKQAQAVALASKNSPQNELAEKFVPKISAQAFGKHLASAQWKLVKESLQFIEQGIHLSPFLIPNS